MLDSYMICCYDLGTYICVLMYLYLHNNNYSNNADLTTVGTRKNGGEGCVYNSASGVGCWYVNLDSALDFIYLIYAFEVINRGRRVEMY